MHVVAPRLDLLTQTRETLATAGFLVSPVIRERPAAFDLLARRDEELLLVKVLQNVDALSEDVAREIRLVAGMLGGRALLVGTRTSAGALEQGVVYVRHHVPLLAIGTLEEWLLEGLPLLAFAGPGGFYVQLDGDALRRHREERGLSLGDLAAAAGVSRRAIRMYESGMGAVVEVAARLEAFLDVPMTRPVDPFALARAPESERAGGIDDVADSDSRSVFLQLSELGLSVVPTARAPFQALAHQEKTMILTGVVTDETAALARAKVFDSLVRVSERRSLFIVRSPERARRAGVTPVVSVKELDALQGSDELFDVMSERAEK